MNPLMPENLSRQPENVRIINMPYLLEECNAATNQGPPQCLLAKQVYPCHDLKLESLLSRMVFLKHQLLEFHFGRDAAPLSQHSLIGDGKSSQLGKAVQRFFISIDEGEPARRVGKEMDRQSQNCRAHHLKAKWNPETGFSSDVSSAIRKPICQNHACDHRNGLEYQQ